MSFGALEKRHMCMSRQSFFGSQPQKKKTFGVRAKTRLLPSNSRICIQNESHAKFSSRFSAFFNALRKFCQAIQQKWEQLEKNIVRHTTFLSGRLQTECLAKLAKTMLTTFLKFETVGPKSPQGEREGCVLPGRAGHFLYF